MNEKQVAKKFGILPMKVGMDVDTIRMYKPWFAFERGRLKFSDIEVEAYRIYRDTYERTRDHRFAITDLIEYLERHRMAEFLVDF